MKEIIFIQDHIKEVFNDTVKVLDLNDFITDVNILDNGYEYLIDPCNKSRVLKLFRTVLSNKVSELLDFDKFLGNPYYVCNKIIVVGSDIFVDVLDGVVFKDSKSELDYFKTFSNEIIKVLRGFNSKIKGSIHFSSVETASLRINIQEGQTINPDVLSVIEMSQG